MHTLPSHSHFWGCLSFCSGGGILVIVPCIFTTCRIIHGDRKSPKWGCSPSKSPKWPIKWANHGLQMGVTNYLLRGVIPSNKWSLQWPRKKHKERGQTWCLIQWPGRPMRVVGFRQVCVIILWSLKDVWVFPKIRVPQNGWFIMENPIKMGWFGGTTIFWKHPYRGVSQLDSKCPQDQWDGYTYLHWSHEKVIYQVNIPVLWNGKDAVLRYMLTFIV